VQQARWRSWIKCNGLSAVALGLALLVIAASLLAPVLAVYDPTAIDLSIGLEPPSAIHWLGTDQLGRDVLSRVLWAGRSSLTVAAVVVMISLTLGLSMGLISGYRGGRVDDFCMRVTDFS